MLIGKYYIFTNMSTPTNMRQFYLTRLMDYLKTATDDAIQKKTDEKRAELMVKLELEVQTYKTNLYKERELVRNFIANPKPNTCYHTQPFRFYNVYDPYSGVRQLNGYTAYCTQCNAELGYCTSNGQHTAITKFSFYKHGNIPREILKIVYPLHSINFNTSSAKSCSCCD